MNFWMCECGKKVSENMKVCPYCKAERSPSKFKAIASALKDKLEAAKPVSRESKAESRVQPLDKPATPPTISNEPIKCQKCSGDNVQTIKMACLSGSTTGTSTAFGISTDLSVGMATIDTKSQSNLVTKLKPGPKPGYGCFNICLAIICVVLLPLGLLVGLFSLSKPDAAGPAAVILIPGVALLVYLIQAKENLKKQINLWEGRITVYETGWVCHRCGHVWIP